MGTGHAHVAYSIYARFPLCGPQSNALATHCEIALFTLGEVALLRETTIGGGVAVKVQALTYSRQAASNGPSTGNNSQVCSMQLRNSPQVAESFAVARVRAGHHCLKTSVRLTGLPLQAYRHRTDMCCVCVVLTCPFNALKLKASFSSCIYPAPALDSAPTPDRKAAVCAQAWTCLGKICMVDEGLAKKCVPLIVQVRPWGERAVLAPLSLRHSLECHGIRRECLTDLAAISLGRGSAFVEIT